MTGRYTVLIVDDEPPVRKALRRVLRYEPYNVVDMGNPLEALDYVQRHPVDLVISDHTMPHMTGLDLLRRIRLLKPSTVRILLTGNATLELAVKAINDGGIFRFVTKPWDNNEFLLAVRLGLRQMELNQESRASEAEEDGSAVSQESTGKEPAASPVPPPRRPTNSVLIGDQDVEPALHDEDDQFELTIPELDIED